MSKTIEEKLEDIMPLEDWLIAYKELIALRDWKGKAMHFLPIALERLQKDTRYWELGDVHHTYLTNSIEVIRELIKEDENEEDTSGFGTRRID